MGSAIFRQFEGRAGKTGFGTTRQATLALGSRPDFFDRGRVVRQPVGL